jgi:hypothetical protein
MRLNNIIKVSALFLISILLSACGGGGGGSSAPAANTPTASSITIVAAVGAPLLNGTVNVICATGSPITSSTGSTGSVQVTLSGQTFPCAVEVSGGTINGAPNTTTYHSIAAAKYAVNVTPLTDLIVANLAGTANPTTWFAGLSTNPATLAAITQTQVDTSLANLRTALSGLPHLSTINPITTAFNPTSGDVSDDMLTALATAMANTGVTHAALLSNAAVPAFTAPVSSFGTALTTAYAGTVSGGGSGATRYAIGGTVYGLTGTVVLQDNGGDNLTISANGTFTFLTTLTSGSAYSVTVLTQPSGQTCAVTSSSGTATANVTSVVVNCTTVATFFSVTPANGDNTVSPATFAGITVNTDSLLDSASVTIANVSLSIGGVPLSFSGVTSNGVPAAHFVMTVNGKGFVFLPYQILLNEAYPLILQYGTTYTFSATVKDTLGRSLVVNSTFTTLPVATPVATCVAPARANLFNVCISPPAATGYTWNDIIKAWVADIGVLVTGANALPTDCANTLPGWWTVGDACWLASVANGTIKLVNSGLVMTGSSTRPIIFAIYALYDSSFNMLFYYTKPIYADVKGDAFSGNKYVGDSGSGNVTESVKGTVNGVKEYIPAFGCYEEIWKAPDAIGIVLSTCPM